MVNAMNRRIEGPLKYIIDDKNRYLTRDTNFIPKLKDELIKTFRLLCDGDDNVRLVYDTHFKQSYIFHARNGGNLIFPILGFSLQPKEDEIFQTVFAPYKIKDNYNIYIVVHIFGEEIYNLSINQISVYYNEKNEEIPQEITFLNGKTRKFNQYHRLLDLF
ncbi:hypothetical protein vipetofem_89 [Enterococcus phage vipetofem]|uniref:Uncharacterized protein n=1 Tax=Enterococcus phage vipetofem TaxID=2719594 RepID=A0A6G9LLX4_9CAUD|nr:hypothetical protein KNU92_gp051 [Enterococcus phage vipetofem]QIQ66387.1 hypothetical protein vipetofem_89 [Enterococcus phage vipetofem]